MIWIRMDKRYQHGQEILSGIDEVASREGWRLIQEDLRNGPAACQPAGIISVGIPGGTTTGVPEVRIGRDVALDEGMVGRCAAQHLQGCGLAHGATVSRIGCELEAKRCRGFAEAMGRRCPAFAFRSADLVERKAAFEPWLRSLPVPLGLFVANDHLGQVVLEDCAGAGLAVPGQCAIIGVDTNVGRRLSVTGQISGILRPFLQLGRMAALRLSRLLLGRAPPGPELVRSAAVCRRSSSQILHCRDGLVRSALGWMAKHYGDPDALGGLSQALGIDREELDRRFAGVRGTTAAAELQRVRIDRACELLARAGNPAFGMVADAVGLTTSGLAVAFRAETGCGLDARISGC